MNTSEQLLITGQKLFGKLGIKAVTVDDLCNDLPISKKTFYKLYDDKKEFVLEVMRYSIKQLKRELIACRRNCDNAIEMLFAQQDILSGFYEMRPLFDPEFLELCPKAVRLIISFREVFLAAGIERNLREGVAAGLYQEAFDLKEVTKAFLLLIDILLLTKGPDKAAAKGALMIFINGITTSCGRALLMQIRG
ncbi:TetR/AcrR family transcriptional regulator [Filimonas effusa]|nr:TetR/AcrR family transcriptional regulator [Filimonas effusa]